MPLINGEYIWDEAPVDIPEFTDLENTIPRALNHYNKAYSIVRHIGTRSFKPDGELGPYTWLTYMDVARASVELMAGLTGLGIGEGDRVIIFAPNRLEWAVTDFACQSIGAVTCPFYSALAHEEILEVARLSDAVAAVVSFDALDKLVALNNAGIHFRHVIVMDDRPDDRAVVLRQLAHLAPVWVSTTPKSEARADELQAVWDEAYAKMTVEGRLYPKVELDLNQEPAEERTPEELAADPDCARFRSYVPPDYVPYHEVKGVTDSSAVMDIVTGTFSGLREAGRRALVEAGKYPALTEIPEIPTAAVTPDTLSTFIFTSGTTGTPKAAMLTHQNILFGAKSLATRGGHTPSDLVWPRLAHDAAISFLPLAHVFSRVVMYQSLQSGVHVGFFGGSIRTLFDDIKLVRPTILPVVPRILQRVYGGVQSKVSKMNPLMRRLFWSQVARREHRMYDLGSDDFTRLDRIMFKSIHEQFGGRVRMMFSGSAPLSTELGRFFQATLCHYLQEGYASSETASAGAVQYPGTRTMGHIGGPLSDIEVKLVPVPELGYDPADSADEPVGEFCIRGRNVFRGYYKNREATAAVLDSDGWFHTGDICKFVLKPGPAVGTASGPAAGPYIKIIDRKSNVMKLSQGEYVATENIQTALAAARHSGQVFVGGSSEEAFLLAVVVPDEATFVAAARKLIEPGAEGDVTPEVVARYCRDPRAIAMVHKEIVAEARKIGLKGFEVPKAVLLEPEAWSVENGMATPSMKLRPSVIRKHYADRLGELYAALRACGADNGRALDPDFEAVAKAVASICK